MAEGGSCSDDVAEETIGDVAEETIGDVTEAFSALELSPRQRKTSDLSLEEKKKREIWKKIQTELQQKLIKEDSEEVRAWRNGKDMFRRLKYVAGVDISFDKEHENRACAMLAVLSFPRLKVLHTCSEEVEMTEPYIAGFLAFREVEFLLDQLKKVKETHPHWSPQVIFVDGNGILHPREFGLACHLGVLSGIPCIGVAKKLLVVDGLEKGPKHKKRIETLKKKGDHFLLTGKSGKTWGAALLTSDGATNPVYVSVGHKISLETALQLTLACSYKRVPEPIRQADLKSRRVVRSPNPREKRSPKPLQKRSPEPLKQRPSSKPVQEPPPEPEQRPLSKPVQEPPPGPEQRPLSKPVQEPPPEPEQRPLSKPVQEPPPEPEQRPLSKPVQEPPPEPEQGPLSKLVQEPPSESLQASP